MNNVMQVKVYDDIPITEQQNPVSFRIDTKTSLEIVKIINDQDKMVAFAVEKVLPETARLIDDVVKAFRNGGRLFYIGAGTSGRLGILDASECPPTYGVSPELVQGIIAGGLPALTKSQEGAEDDPGAGITELKHRQFSPVDVIIGISASGDAPFVVAALEYAQSLGAVAGMITCNQKSKALQFADHKIFVDVGPEIIAGSTRMKAGTAQKLILNMISTVSMIRLGKVYNNLMVDLCPLNNKLKKRSERLIAQISGCSEIDAARIFKEANGKLKAGILMAMLSIDLERATQLLNRGDGSINLAIDIHNQKDSN